MGTYLNEGNALYARAVNSEIHVDKSLLIRETNRRICTQDQYICLSRPRRFGKSMAAHMLMAYYTRGANSRELFKDKKICQDPSFEKHFEKYNVIHLRMTDFVAGEMVLVGINYRTDPENPGYKHHTCVIERWQK